MEREFQRERRIGDPFRVPRISDALKKRYLCVHVKQGLPVAVRLDTPYGIIAACENCQSLETLQVTDECQVF